MIALAFGSEDAFCEREAGKVFLLRKGAKQGRGSNLTPFEEFVAALPECHREVLTMLKVNGLSVEEVAHATSATVTRLSKRPIGHKGGYANYLSRIHNR
jgi:DNA-directed RNA polymerase specialized sigma24 family protein